MKLATLLTPALVALGLLLLALAVRGVLLRHLGRVERADSESAALLRRGLRLPSLLWSAVVALYGGMEAAALPPRLAGRLELLLQALIVLSVTVTAANLLAALVARFGERRTLSVGVTGLAQAVVRISVLTVGGLILLSGLGVAITPVLTALGVGGLAVALALQDTLSNLFAGVHLLADKPIRVGDFVRLESGVEGFESSLDFTLICRVASFVDRYLVQHELRERILWRFRAEGIEIPFPARTVELRSPDAKVDRL